MLLRSCSITDIGRQRQLNQDYVFTSEVTMGSLPNLFIVADGMGGHKAGEFASKCAVETVVNEVALSSEKRSIKLLSSAIQKANERIRQKASTDDNYQGMGTTLVVATYDGEEMCVANVGQFSFESLVKVKTPEIYFLAKDGLLILKTWSCRKTLHDRELRLDLRTF